MTTDSSCSNVEFYGNIFFNLLLETADLYPEEILILTVHLRKHICSLI